MKLQCLLFRYVAAHEGNEELLVYKMSINVDHTACIVTVAVRVDVTVNL